MSHAPDITLQLRRELDETRARLAEAQQTLDAIRNGMVDGLVVHGPGGPQVFTLQGAQEPYRLLIEQMSEGALTLSRAGVIFYTNQTFARLLQTPLGQVIGADLRSFLGPADQEILAGLIATAWDGRSRGEVFVRAADGSAIPVRLGLSRLHLNPELMLCVVATDLTEEKQHEDAMRRLQADLETRVVQRTADLSASRLAALSAMEEAVESKRALETANRELSDQVRERERTEEVQNFLANASSGEPHEPFFHALARYLARSLGMDFVCIDRLEGDGLTARTVAVWCDGHFEDNVSYALKDTPCGDVVGQMVCCFPASVCQFFPRDQVLRDLQAESYVGVTLWSHTGQPIGLIAVISRRPLAGTRALAEATLRLVAARTAGELERLEAELALRQSEAFNRDALNSLSAHLAVLDDQGIITTVNEAWRRFARENGADVPGAYLGANYFSVCQTATDRSPQTDAAAVLQGIRAVMDGAQPSFALEYPCDSTTQQRWFCLQVRPLAGARAGVIVAHENITTRKQAEEALRRSEERHRVVTDTMLHGVVYQRGNGTILAMNPAAERILGRTTAEFLGSSSVQEEHHTVHEDGSPFPGMEHPAMVALRTSQPVRSVVMGVWNPQRKERRWIEIDAVPVFASGQALPTEVYTVFADITERKQTQQDLRKLNQELEHRVAERTQELAESEANLRLAAQGAGFGTFVYYFQDARAYWSPELKALYGLEPHEDLALDAEGVPLALDVRDRAGFLAAMTSANTVGGDGLLQLKYRILRRDGVIRWLCVNGKTEFAGPAGAGSPLRSMGAVTDITAQVEAEGRLQESKANLRAFFDTIDYFCFILDLQGNILRANQTVATRLGYTEAEWTGMSVLQLHPPNRRAEAGGIVTAMLAGTCSFCPVPLQAKDGTLVPVETRVVAGTWSGQPALFGVSKDISELRRSEEKFAALFHHNPLPMALTSIPDGRFVEVNAAFALVTGYPQAEVIGSSPLELFSSPDQGAALVRLMAERESFEHEEWCLRTKAGSLRHGLFSGDLVRFQSDSLWLTVMDDITERKTAEVQLRKLWSTVEQSPVAVVITDATGTIEYVNPRFYQQTGYTSAEVVGRNPRFLKSGRHTPEFYAGMWATLQTGQTWRGELCNRRKDGVLFWESTAIAPVRTRDGRISHFVASKEDITERRRIAEELRQAKEAADAANLAKSQFLANMSHEIHTPMNAILGFSQLMMRSAELPALQRRQLTTINRSGEHLMEILNDILEIARIESGRVALNVAPLDLHRLLDDLEAMFRPRVQAKDLRFHIERQGHVPPRVVGDETKLRQVFINLLGNAVKFTPGGGSIVLRLRAQPDGTDAWQLHAEVRDSGEGIAPEDLGHLFEPFFQAATGRQTAGGTGLGLAISRKFVRLMDGEISADSQPGVGSCFRFQVRVGRADAPGARTASAPAARVLHLKPGQPACRVLAVDDQPENRELIVQMLAPLGFEIRTAADGAEAVARCAEWLPQIVLMDLRMPVMDGYEATQRIRAAHGAAVKLIVLSAFAFAEDGQRARAAGADAFLSKPFQENKLLDLIQQLVGVDYV